MAHSSKPILPPTSPVRAGAWALYDLANTIFSLNIITLYFPVWLNDTQDVADYSYNYALIGAMAIVLIIAPPLGHWADAHARRRWLLNLSTILCIVATASLAFAPSAIPALGLFICAAAAYYLASTFYDSLLTYVAPPDRQNQISGIGVGVGYLGSIAGLHIVGRLAQGSDGVVNAPHAFIWTAVFFLIFALPCMLLAPEGPPMHEKQNGGLRENLRQTWQALREHRQAWIFLIVSFLFLNGVNAVYANLGLYLNEAAQFSDAQCKGFLTLGIVAAMLAAWPIGWLAEKYHPKNALLGVIVLWIATLLLLVLDTQHRLIQVAAVFIGFGLAGAWTVTRPLLLTLVPEEQTATFFGFNALTGRFSAIFGLGIWGLVMKIFQDRGPERYSIGLATLAVLACVALVLACFIPRKTQKNPA
ncbi:MFS transporter [Candidatus Sumerlaeota bacterium]|nr:MFS transporter [Candidatus Sumerlaeota bacterium]